MRMKRIVALILALVLTGTCFSSVSYAEDSGIRLYIDNVEQKLKNPCIVENGTVYIPMEEVFFKMGVYMSWKESEKCWFGTGNNGEIRITVGSMTADIDWVYVELPAPVIEKNGVVMVPLYIVEDALKTDPAVYDEKTKSIYIKFPDISYKAEKANFQIESVVNSLPKPHQDLFPEDRLYNLEYDNGTELLDYQVVDVEGMPFAKAAQIEMKPMEDYPKMIYGAQMHTIIDTGTFEAGDVGLASFWARATKITDESGVARMRFCYEQLGDWQKATNEIVSIGKEWKKYYVPMYSAMYTLQSGASHLCFSVGGKAQIIQVADVHMYTYGKDVDIKTLIPDSGKQYYHGMEDDALWRKEAYRRIEKYRKNDMAVTVTDENGNPVEGATVKADMTENEFRYGVAISDNEMLDLDTGTRQGRIQSEVLDKYFNTGVSGNEMKEQSARDDYRTGAREINEYLRRGMQARGHAIAWDLLELQFGFDKNDIIAGKQPYQEMHDWMLNLMKGKIWLFKGTLFQWDGLNEPTDSNRVRSKYGTQMYSDIFKLAKAIDPKCKLYVNETGMEGYASRDSETRVPAFLDIVKKMIEEERAPIDGLGIQGHCINLNYPQGMYNDIEKLSQVVDEVAITEYDYYNTDYTLAPQYLHDMFLTFFSHPKASSFIVWGYYDPMHWRRYGLFYDESWNAKPELEMWNNIVNKEFTTHETAVTDKDGKAVIRGLRGKYEITVEKDGVIGKNEFMLTNSDNTERDNWVKAVIKSGKFEFANPNPYESYSGNNSAGRTQFNSMTEAYADYVAKFGDREQIGIYKHSDNNGNRVPKTTDGLYNTYWYGKDGEYLNYELVDKADRGSVSVDFRTPLGEVYNYKILTSADGENWETLYEGKSDEKKTILFENVMFVRIQSVGNEYMGISEVNINAEKD